MQNKCYPPQPTINREKCTRRKMYKTQYYTHFGSRKKAKVQIELHLNGAIYTNVKTCQKFGFLSQNLSDLKASSHSNMSRLICILKSQVRYQSRSYFDSNNCISSILTHPIVLFTRINRKWLNLSEACSPIQFCIEVATKLKLSTVLCCKVSACHCNEKMKI
jgi:hypothetical protein